MTKKKHGPGKGGPGFGIIAYGGLILLVVFITYPFWLHDYKFHHHNTLSLYLAKPSEIGMTDIQDIHNRNPLLEDGVYMISFKITPEGADKLLKVHDWKQVSTTHDRDFAEMRKHLKGSSSASYYEWNSPTSRVQVDLLLNADRTHGVLYLEKI